MFKTIKAKLILYKWGFIVLMFAALSIIATVQYYRIEALNEREHAAKILADAQEQKITSLTDALESHKLDTEKAFRDLNDLRKDFETIDNKTTDLKRQLNGLPKIEKGGANSAQVETEANKLSNDVMKRLEDATRANK